MTYDEFKAWCDENHFVYDEDDGAIHVFSDDSSAGTVSKIDRYHMDSWYYDESVGMVFEKLVELAQTPLCDREKPKRYIVKTPTEMPKGFYALTRNGAHIYMRDDNDPDLGEVFELTEEEIKKIDERFMVFAVGVKEK